MAEHSQVDRKRLWEMAQKGHSAEEFLLLSALILLWATVLAAGAAGSAGKSEAGRPEGAFPASRLIGMAVNDAQGLSIAEIEDFVMNGEGTVEKAILAVGGVADMGEKLVAVSFD
jgi:hypothetical protein